MIVVVLIVIASVIGWILAAVEPVPSGDPGVGHE